MTTTTNRTLDDRRAAVIHAGADIIRSSKLDWANGITYDVLETASGVDRGQITRDFGSKADVIRAIIGQCLDTDQSDLDEYFVRLNAAISDRSVPVDQALQKVGDIDDHFIRNNRRVYAQMLLWSAAGADEELATQIRTFYHAYDDRKANIICTEIQARFDDAGIRLREGLSCAEFMAVITAMSEGLAVRTAIDPGAAEIGVTGTIYTMLTEALIDDSADGPTTIGERLRASGV